MHKWSERVLLWAVLVIPLDHQGSWEVLKYRNIKPNIIEFSSEGLRIGVDQSASPVIYPLKSAVGVKGFEAKGKLEGDLKIPDGYKQGVEKGDDFSLRVGLVLSGQKRLSRWQSLVAPQWIKRLHALAPPSGGIDHIEFFNVIKDPSLTGQSRTHPKSELLIENFMVTPDSSGEFEMKKSFLPSKEVIALWLSSDGDDTASKFLVKIKSLNLGTDAH